MKKILILIVALMAIAPVFGQQLPLYSLYQENNFLLNPAIAGSDGHGVALLSYRRQWTKVKGAPETYSASYRTLLHKTNLGLGGYVINDRTGPTSFTGGTVTASYHISFEKINPFRWPLFLRQSKISVGLSASVYQYRLNSNDLQLDQPNDPAINTVENQKWSPNAGLGVYYYYDKFFLGFSMPNVIPLNVQFDEATTESNLKRALHYYVVVGGKIPLDKKGSYKPRFALEPMVWFRTVKGAPFQIDGHLRFKYKDLFWIGGGYRSMKTVVADAGVMIKGHLQISYAYDQSLLDVRSYIGSSHEIILAYHFDAKKRYKRYK